MTAITGEEAAELEKRTIFPSYPNITFDEKYKNEWKNILKILENNKITEVADSRIKTGLEYLKELAFAGELKVSRFRSLLWSLLLRVISDSPDHWIEEKTQQRIKYEKLKEEFIRDPHDGDKNDNPLSESKQSVWNQYFRDQELLSVIRQDVVRTFPGVDFFRKQSIQESMINILFYYAREHPYMSYRQGMHEILAPVLFVLYYDYQNYQELSSFSDIDKRLMHIMNKDYFEADSYSIFSRLMTSIEAYYRMPNLTPTAEGHFPPQIEKLEGNFVNIEVEIVKQLNHIKERILIKEDLHLHNHLNKLDIPPHIYGIRWLRLLFGREFSLQDLLILWDAIFADSDKFELPNYIFAAMLIRIRDKLLLSDYTTCLTYLMRYPNNIDVGLIIKHALHMQNPKKYERPPNAIVYVTMKPTDLNQAQNNVKSALKSTNNSPKHSSHYDNNNSKNNNSSNKYRNSQERQRSSSIAGETSFSNNKELYHHINLNEIPYSNSLNAAKYENYGVISNSDTRIIDGYREDVGSPQFLRLELNNAQTVMKISKMKLEEYLTILRSNVGRSKSEKVNQALDGIEELCAFLDVKPIPAHNPISQPIDSALEANEQAAALSSLLGIKLDNKDTEINEKLRNTSVPTAKLSQKKILSELESKKEFVKQLISSQDIQNIDEMAESVISSSLMNSSPPLSLQLSNLDSNKAIIMDINKKNNIRYEVPDNGFMEKSKKILGHKKEVELKIFKEDNNQNVQKMNNNEVGRGLPEPDPIGLREDK